MLIKMIIEVWEVYKRDSQECCMFKTRELAENQSVFEEVDLIGKVNVDLNDEQIHELNRGRAVW
jgi:hypothetical protein